ncbi:MAG TPA: methyltransferase domain-containing protein [Thermoanaerobaculia bacterium]|jgi:predicted SAM-dependent methyltransferase
MPTNLIRAGLIRAMRRWHLEHFIVGASRDATVALRRLSGIDRRIIGAYFTENDHPKLHIGAGHFPLSGWLNTSWFPVDRGCVFMDATRAFPFPDDSFDHVMSEHMIEHVAHSGAATMIAECHRVLRPGGRLRLTTPDLGFLINLLRDDLDDRQVRYIGALAAVYGIEASGIATFNHFVRAWGHAFIYTPEELARMLTAAGFTAISFHRLNESDDPALRNIEHPERMADGFLQLESMTLECTKPKAPRRAVSHGLGSDAAAPHTARPSGRVPL